MAGARSGSDWNPMHAAHNDQQFNSYSEGPGRNYQTSGGAKDNSKLYVRNIPKELTEEGLRTVFTNATGVIPNRVTIPISRMGSQYATNFAFIDFGTPSAATKAIMVLHKTPTLNLDVTYQRPKVDLGGRQGRPADALMPRTEATHTQREPPPNASGVISWEGVRRAGYDGDCDRERDRAWSDPKDAFVEPRTYGHYDPRGGANGVADLETNGALGLNVSVGMDSRRVSRGRGYFPPSAGVNGPVNRQPNIAPRSPQAAGPIAQTSRAVATQLPAHPCQFCMRPASNLCGLCKVTHYCDATCANKHWSAHQHVCIMLCKPPGVIADAIPPVAAVSSPVEAPVVTPTPSVAAASKPTPAVASPVVAVPMQPVSEVAAAVAQLAIAHGIDNYEDIPLGEFTAVTVSEAEGPTAWVSVDSRGDTSYETVAAITARNDLAVVAAPSVGGYVAAYFCGEWYRGRVVKLNPLTVLYVDYGNIEEVALDKIRSLPVEYLREPAQAVRISVMPSAAGTRRSLVANQQLSVCAVRKVGDLTHVRLESDVVDDKPKTAAVAELPAAASPKPQCQGFIQPLFEDRAVKVYFVSKEGDARHIQPVESSLVLNAMLTEFDALGASSALRPCTSPAVGQVTLAKFEGDWSRCKILSSEAGNKFHVVFIDYGNESTVGANEIFELPEKHKLIAGQCAKVHFADTPSAVIELPEFQVFLATLIAKTQDGSLIVRGKME